LEIDVGTFVAEISSQTDLLILSNRLVFAAGADLIRIGGYKRNRSMVSKSL